jgi:hypothetical protein
MQFWLNLPGPVLFLALAVPYGLIAFLIYWTAFRARWHTAIHTFEGIVPTFIGAIGILFGLLTGFLANDVADRNRQATQAVLSEANALQDAFTLSRASASDMPGIRTALRQYAQSALHDEWPHIADIGRDAKTEQAFEDLLRTVSDPSVARDAGQAVQTAMIGAVSRAGIARSERLSIGGDITSGIKWLTVIVLGVLTQIAIGLVHLQRPRAHIAALGLFSVSVVVVLGLVALQEQPFSGPVQVSTWPIEEFLATATAAAPPASETPAAAAH